MIDQSPLNIKRISEMMPSQSESPILGPNNHIFGSYYISHHNFQMPCDKVSIS